MWKSDLPKKFDMFCNCRFLSYWLGSYNYKPTDEPRFQSILTITLSLVEMDGEYTNTTGYIQYGNRAKHFETWRQKNSFRDSLTATASWNQASSQESSGCSLL